MASPRRKFDPDWVVHPGATLAEWIEEMGVPKSTAALYGIDERTLDRILDGRQKITKPLAQKLCNWTLIGAPMWLALEHNFRVGFAAGKYWDGAPRG